MGAIEDYIPPIWRNISGGVDQARLAPTSQTTPSWRNSGGEVDHTSFNRTSESGGGNGTLMQTSESRSGNGTTVLRLVIATPPVRHNEGNTTNATVSAKKPDTSATELLQNRSSKINSSQSRNTSTAPVTPEVHDTGNRPAVLKEKGGSTWGARRRRS